MSHEKNRAGRSARRGGVVTKLDQLDSLFRRFLSWEVRSWPFADRHALHCILSDLLEEFGDVEAAQCLRLGRFSVVQRKCDGIYLIVPFLLGPIGGDVHHIWSWFMADPSKLEGAQLGRDYIAGKIDWTYDGTFTRSAESAFTPDGLNLFGQPSPSPDDRQ